MEKLFNLIKKDCPEHAMPETRQALEDITARCDPCQQPQTAPLRFRASCSAGICRFNERIIVYIMYLNEDPVLHIFDERTHFRTAKFVPNIQAITLWKTVLNSWETIYTGMPHRIVVDQGSSFGEPFTNLARMGGVKIQRPDIEAHSSLHIGEQYQQPLCITFCKPMFDHPGADKQLTLALSVKAMNEKLVPDGVVSSTLVFGLHPAVYIRSEIPKSRPTLNKRAKIAEEARQEVENHMAKMRTDCALRLSVPPASGVMYERDDEILI